MSNKKKLNRGSANYGSTGVRRRRRKPYILSYFQRGLIAILALSMVSAVVWAAINVVRLPYIWSAQQSVEIAQKQAELEQLNAENAMLARRKAYLSRPDGIEALARTQGYLKPGEQSLIIETTPSGGATQQ